MINSINLQKNMSTSEVHNRSFPVITGAPTENGPERKNGLNVGNCVKQQDVPLSFSPHVVYTR